MSPRTWKTGLIVSACILFAAAGLYTYLHSEVFSREEGEEKEEREGGIEKEMSAWWWSKGYPDPGNIGAKYAKAWKRAQEMRRQASEDEGKIAAGTSGSSGILYQRSSWTSIGPNQNIGGRILSIAIDPNNGNNLFAGSASGGIWKSTNGGTSWQSVSTGYPVLGVSSIVYHPANSSILFAGTGEIYRLDSVPGTPNPNTTGLNVWKTRGTYGVGILKSSDGGTTWTQVFAKDEVNMFAVQRLKFNPRNPNTIYACGTDGLYRSVDGGTSWNIVIQKGYVSDVVINAKDSNQLVIGVGNLQNTDKGIYRSIDNGVSWTKITSGLPGSFQGFIRLDNVPTAGNRDTIIASIGVAETGSPTELYRSTNFGSTWTGLSGSTHASYQYWCAHTVAINPGATNKLIYAGVNVFSYNISSSGSSSIGGIHSDIHDIKFDPGNNTRVYITCDGGVYKSTNSGGSFSQINNGLGAVQFYASMGYSTTADILVGGLQDNGVVQYNGASWTSVIGSDGAACFIDPTNNSNILASYDARGIFLSNNTGGSYFQVLSDWVSKGDSRTGFVPPLGISKSNPQVMYVATDNLHVSADGGNTWTNATLGAGAPATTPSNFIDKIHKTAIALAISSTNENKVYVSVSPFAQYDNDVDNLYFSPTTNVMRTTTGNTPFASIMGSSPNNLPNRYIMDFAISPTNDDSVWVAVGGFGTPHVYVTGNGGTTWTSRDPGLSGSGLPDVPANAIMLDPKNPKIIYVGNDFGVYVSADGGATWMDFNKGLWDATQVVDLVPGPGNKIRAATHGKGVFETILYSTVLPVNLLDFTGEVRGNSVQLNWQTSQESSLSHFELERSSDGIHYYAIASVWPRGGTGRNTYSYDDGSAFAAGSKLQYRLKSIDLDGDFVYSNIVSIGLSSQEGMIVLGTAFSTVLKLRIQSAIEQTVYLRLYDVAGKLLSAKPVALLSGSNDLVLDELSRLPRGTYLVSAVTTKQQFTEKVVKFQ